jgi:hypothetical protein
MSRKWMVLATVAVVVLAFAAGVVVFTGRTNQEVTAAAQTHSDALVRPHSPIYGNPAAKVTIVEFFDPSCEACSAFYPIVKRIVNASFGQVRLVVRYAPLHHDTACGSLTNTGTRSSGRVRSRVGRAWPGAIDLGRATSAWTWRRRERMPAAGPGVAAGHRRQALKVNRTPLRQWHALATRRGAERSSSAQGGRLRKRKIKHGKRRCEVACDWGCKPEPPNM